MNVERMQEIDFFSPVAGGGLDYWYLVATARYVIAGKADDTEGIQEIRIDLNKMR